MIKFERREGINVFVRAEDVVSITEMEKDNDPLGNPRTLSKVVTLHNSEIHSYTPAQEIVDQIEKELSETRKQ
jgi:hypothetical protein